MIKRKFAATTLFLLILTQIPGLVSAEQRFSTLDARIEFEFPDGWYENDKKHPYDLQCLSKHKQMTTGVFVYLTQDLAENLAPIDVLHWQINDLKSKRKNFKIKGEEQVVRAKEKRLTSVVFSGEKNLSRYYYRFTLIEFDENPEIIAVVLQVALPSNWTEHKPILGNITKSARLKEQ